MSVDPGVIRCDAPWMAALPVAPRRSLSIIDLGSLLYLGAVWGAVFLFMRIAAPQVGPVWAADIRLLVGAVVLLAALLWAWRAVRGPEVNVVSPARGVAVEIVYATGAVEPVRWAKVTSLIRQRIIEICDCEGHQVKRGDVLARLDDKEIRAQLHELKAREEFAKAEVSRTTELIARGAGKAKRV